VTASQRSIFVAQMPQIVLAPKLDKTASSGEPAVAAAAGLGGTARLTARQQATRWLLHLINSSVCRCATARHQSSWG